VRGEHRDHRGVEVRIAVRADGGHRRHVLTPQALRHEADELIPCLKPINARCRLKLLSEPGSGLRRQETARPIVDAGLNLASHELSLTSNRYRVITLQV